MQRGKGNTGNPEVYFSENVNNIVVKLNCYNSTSQDNKEKDEADVNITEEVDVNVNVNLNNENMNPEPFNNSDNKCDALPSLCSKYNSNINSNENGNGSGSVYTSTPNNGSTVEHLCEVKNFPMQKWVNLIISVYGRTLDIYIDGKLVRTCVLPGVVKVNKGSDLYITPDDGFYGFTSNVLYRPEASNPQEAYNIYYRGYGSNMFTSNLNKYKLKVALLTDNVETSSIKI